MKRKQLFWAMLAMAMLLGLNSPAFSCDFGASTITSTQTNYTGNHDFILVDRDSGTKMVCHRVEEDDTNSDIVCHKVEFADPAIQSLPLSKSVEATPADIIPPNALWVLVIIGLHFVMGLVHTWFREKKKK